jgi:hypothetical protein
MNITKLQEFRETLTFSESVYLPSDIFSKKEWNICDLSIEVVTKRLVNTAASEHPWNRLSSQLVQSHPRQADVEDQLRRPTLIRTPLTPLHSYACWLQADLAGLFFDWLQLGVLCADIWLDIKKLVEPLEGWDSTTFNCEKPAAEPALNICIRDKDYPNFLEAAYDALLKSPTKPPNCKDLEQRNADICPITLGKLHHATAAMLRAPEPLNLNNLYAQWPKKKRYPRWEAMRLSHNDEMVDIMMDNILEHSKSMDPGHDPGYLDNLFSGSKKGDVLRSYVQAMADACLKLGHMPLQLRESFFRA